MSAMPCVLLADKDTRYASVLRRWFEPRGVSCSFLSDGSKLVSCAKELDPVAVVCSLRVDCEDGFESMRCLKEDERTKGIPCIVLTDLAEREDIKRCYSLGCAAYFIKRHTKPEYLFTYLNLSGYLA